MTKYARIQSGVVAETIETDGDIKQLFHPELLWVACDAGTQVGDLFEGGLFTRPVVPLSSLKAQKAAELDAACASAIIGGFSSSALGSLHTYPSKQTDQANLVASVVDAIDNASTPGWVTPFWCADASGEWGWRNHSADQIRQVGRDGKAAILSAQSRNATLQSELQNTMSEEAVNAIRW